MFKLDLHHAVLSTSGNALRSTHIIALALLGLIVQDLGGVPRDIDAQTLRPVVSRRLDLCENMAKVAIGGAHKKGEQRCPSSGGTEILQTFEMEIRTNLK